MMICAGQQGDGAFRANRPTIARETKAKPGLCRAQHDFV